MASLSAKTTKVAPNSTGGLPHMRVLFPLDGSEQSYRCMELAFSFLPSSNVQATILVVLSDFRGAPAEVIQRFEDDTDDEVFPTEDSALVVLRQATKRLREKGVKLTLKIAKGRVGKEILAEAANHDLVVMHKGPGDKRFGGASAIARKAGCSALMVRV